MASDYPIDLRADRPDRSSRGWAALTILLIKFIALIPQAIVLIFLSIAQAVVAVIAQVVVAVRGEYPPGMFDFVAGVLRWSTRVSAFVLSLTDRYPPFTLRSDGTYPVDVLIERPARSSRLYALFTLIVEALVLGVGIWLAIRYASDVDWNSTSRRYTNSPYGWSGLFLRDIAALPHIIVLFFLGIAVFVVWFIVQWVILFTASYPRGMYDFVAGVLRWQTRVSAYTLGLSDRYPPFTLEPTQAVGEGGAAAPAVPPPPPPPVLPQA